MPFYYGRYKDQVVNLDSRIKAYADKRQSIIDDRTMSDEFKQTRLAALDTEHANMIDSTFNDIRNHIAAHVKDAQEKVIPKNIPFDERTYATAAAQDIANRSPKEIVALYNQAAKDGRKAYTIELQRLVGDKMEASDYVKPWNDAVRQNMTANEATAYKLRTLAPKFNDLLTPTESIMKEAQNDIAKGSEPYMPDSASIMDAVINKVQQSAAEL
jgi:hypothetical protein